MNFIFYQIWWYFRSRKVNQLLNTLDYIIFAKLRPNRSFTCCIKTGTLVSQKLIGVANFCNLSEIITLKLLRGRILTFYLLTQQTPEKPIFCSLLYKTGSSHVVSQNPSSEPFGVASIGIQIPGFVEFPSFLIKCNEILDEALRYL